MNWCQEHWQQLRVAVAEQGLADLVAKNGEECASRVEAGDFEPLSSAYMNINTAMLRDVGLFVTCPCCLLVEHKQPELVKDWIDGAVNDQRNEAIKRGLIKGPDA